MGVANYAKPQSSVSRCRRGAVVVKGIFLNDFLIISLLIFLLVLGACGQNGQPVPDGTVDLEEVDPRGQEVTFWYQHTRQREEALLELIEEFNQKNPHRIQVRGEYAGGYGDIYNKMLVALQGGGIPQIVVAYQNQALAYYHADGIVDLTPYIYSPKWGLAEALEKDFIQSFVAQDRVGGIQVGFPPNRSMEILYYNADWLRELGYEGPPQNWAAFAEMCRKASLQPFSRAAKKDRSMGFLLEPDASRLASMVFSRGGDFMNPAGTAYTLNTPQARAALELMQDLVRSGAAGLVGEPYADQTDFSLGQILFALRSSSGLPNFKSGVEEEGVGFEWKVTTLPHEGSEPVVNVYGASVSVCRSTPAQQLAAWLFVRWFTESAQQARWVQASNYFPVRKSTARDLKDYFGENPHYEAAYQLLDYGRSEPSVAGYQQVRRLIGDAMVEILDGAAPAAVLSRLEREANKTLVNP